MQSLVALYKALGGGWQPEETEVEGEATGEAPDFRMVLSIGED